MSTQVQIAASRFGLGPRMGEPLPSDPKPWLLAQIDQPGPPPEGASGAEVMQLRHTDQLARRSSNPEGDPVAARAALGAQIRAESMGFAERRLTAEQPFRERLVDFWMNHFTVSRRSGSIQVLIGDYERQAIRPHVTGRFGDMLLAVARHPAMLVYLDNAGSVGPASPAGQRRRQGLNENLAREILELHTLSLAGGYTQGDVEEFAKILTGWSFAGDREPWGFAFRGFAHQPGDKHLLGRRFPAGEAGGVAALAFLAGHPATYRHLAVKLARHFVADDPPPEAVSALNQVLRDSKGDLSAVARALVDLPQAWDPPLAKFRAPMDYVIATCRALGVPANQAGLLLGGLGTLAQPLWQAPQPNGWADVAAEWATPEALMRRVDWAYTMAGRMQSLDAGAVAEAALGESVREETVTQMRRAGSVRDALTLLFGSPEFMFR